VESLGTASSCQAVNRHTSITQGTLVALRGTVAARRPPPNCGQRRDTQRRSAEASTRERQAD
jgi:hypothetical protein